MSDDHAILRLWEDGAAFDHSICVKESDLPALKRKQVRAVPFSRQDMFGAMARRSIAIFRGMPVNFHRLNGLDSRESLIHALSTMFPKKARSWVQVGPSATLTRLPVREIMRRWKGGRAIVGVTDLHIRGTKVEDVIDTRPLSDFNVLIHGSEELSLEEMMTLVIASPGNVTNSHSDDPDGTNHCFFGKKLWLAWETFEGIQAGLQDVMRQDIHGVVKFDVSTFLSMKSARWFVVSAGDTLFLPSNVTHKVITLEYYIGVGSFHVGLPGCLDNLSRWLHYGPLWSMCDPKNENGRLVDEIAHLCVRIARRNSAASPRTQRRWGYRHMAEGYRHWQRHTDGAIKREVMRHPDIRELVKLAKQAA